MAILTVQELAATRQEWCAVVAGAAGLTKPQLNAAAQAVEDILVGAALQTAISNAINAATSPVTLSAQEKRQLVAYVLRRKAERDK